MRLKVMRQFKFKVIFVAVGGVFRFWKNRNLPDILSVHIGLAVFDDSDSDID